MENNRKYKDIELLTFLEEVNPDYSYSDFMYLKEHVNNRGKDLNSVLNELASTNDTVITQKLEPERIKDDTKKPSNYVVTGIDDSKKQEIKKPQDKDHLYTAPANTIPTKGTSTSHTSFNDNHKINTNFDKTVQNTIAALTPDGKKVTTSSGQRNPNDVISDNNTVINATNGVTSKNGLPTDKEAVNKYINNVKNSVSNPNSTELWKNDKSTTTVVNPDNKKEVTTDGQNNTGNNTDDKNYTVPAKTINGTRPHDTGTATYLVGSNKEKQLNQAKNIMPGQYKKDVEELEKGKKYTKIPYSEIANSKLKYNVDTTLKPGSTTTQNNPGTFTTVVNPKDTKVDDKTKVTTDNKKAPETVQSQNTSTNTQQNNTSGQNTNTGKGTTTQNPPVNTQTSTQVQNQQSVNNTKKVDEKNETQVQNPPASTEVQVDNKNNQSSVNTKDNDETKVTPPGTRTRSTTVNPNEENNKKLTAEELAAIEDEKKKKEADDAAKQKTTEDNKKVQQANPNGSNTQGQNSTTNTQQNTNTGKGTTTQNTNTQGQNNTQSNNTQTTNTQQSNTNNTSTNNQSQNTTQPSNNQDETKHDVKAEVASGGSGFSVGGNAVGNTGFFNGPVGGNAGAGNNFGTGTNKFTGNFDYSQRDQSTNVSGNKNKVLGTGATAASVEQKAAAKSSTKQGVKQTVSSDWVYFTDKDGKRKKRNKKTGEIMPIKTYIRNKTTAAAVNGGVVVSGATLKESVKSFIRSFEPGILEGILMENNFDPCYENVVELAEGLLNGTNYLEDSLIEDCNSKNKKPLTKVTNNGSKFLEALLVNECGMPLDEFTNLSEETQVESVKEIAINVIKVIEEKLASIDTTCADRSRGDIKNLKELPVLQDVITQLEALVERDENAIPEYSKAIAVIIKSILYINQYSNIFKDAYRNKKSLMILKYQSLILSIITSVSYLISTIVDYRVDHLTLKRNVEGLMNFAPLKSLEQFIQSVDSGEFKLVVTDTNTLREYYLEVPVETMSNILEAADYLPMIIDGVQEIYKNIVGNNKLTNLVYRAAGVVVLILSIRDALYTIFRMKTRVNDMVGGLENFANLNSGANVLNKLGQFTSKFKADAETSSNISTHEINTENKEFLSDVKNIQRNSAIPALNPEVQGMPSNSTEEIFGFDF